jgi:thioredoxin-related protein
VDVDKAKRLADAYFVRGLPMGWFVSPEGEKLAPLPGYVPPDEFLTILKYIHTDAYEDHSYHEWMEMGGGK